MKQQILKVMMTAAFLAFTVGCNKKQTADNTRVIRKNGQSPSQSPLEQSQIDQQALSVGLNISWDQTEPSDLGQGLMSLKHTYQIQKTSFVFQHNIYTSAVDCALVTTNQYDAQVMQSQNNAAAAVGFIPCRSGNDLYVGLSFFAWGNSSYINQHLVLINLTRGGFINDYKIFNASYYITDLANWVSSQFNN